MPRCSDILNQVVARSGLDRKDSHPLYSYRVTLDELDLLQVELRTLFNGRGSLRTVEECGAFCLFGAEWFRRNYRSGPWSWDVIFDALDLGPNTQTSLRGDVGEYVREGLKYWSVNLLSTQLMNLYLRTVVCQGGFPINTLRNDGAGISQMLKACLRDHERFQAESMDEIIHQHIDRVPPTLQNGEVRRLAANLVKAIAQLRKQSDPASTNGLTRAKYLDQNFEGWELKLPLRVEEPEAKEILLSLLGSAKAEPLSRYALSVRTAFLYKKDKAILVRSLHCPSTLSEKELKRVYGVPESEELSPRMTGYLQAGDQRVAAINLARSNDGSSFRLTKYPSISLSGSQAFFETYLSLAVGGEEIHRISLPGGTALPESPWIFTSDEEHHLIGVGSARLRDESVMIAIPSNCEIRLSEGAELVEEEFTLEERNVLKVTGEIYIFADDVQYRVSTKSTGSSDCLFELRGTSRRLGIGGSQVWCGPPKVWQIPFDEERLRTEVSRDQLQWKPVGGASWSSDFSECLGNVQIRVLQEGNTCYLTRAIVLPREIELKVVPGLKPGTGELRISGLGKCKIKVERDERIRIQDGRSDGNVVLEVNTLEARPNLIRIRVTFLNETSCNLSVVCPTTSYSILNVLGQPVDYPDGIPTDNLDGLTLQAILPDKKPPLVYWPDGPLLIDRMRDTSVPGVFEYPLSYIASYATELLACSDDPDGKVKFGVGTNVSFTPNFPFAIARYSHSLTLRRNQDEESIEVCVKGGAGAASKHIADCDLTVVPLGSPNGEMSAESVTSLDSGRWLVNHSDYPPGYYLAIPKDSVGTSYRPLRFHVKNKVHKVVSEEDNYSRPGFWETMNISDKSIRLKAWDSYINEVATDLAHPDWSYLDDFVDSTQSLPVTTFEAVAAITRNHLAAARYGILFPGRERLWRRFEQLPFLWSAIPIRAWLATAAGCWSFAKSRLVESGMKEEQFEKILGNHRDQFVKEAPNRSASMASIVLGMFVSERFDIPPTVTLQQLDRRLNLEERSREHTRLISYHQERFDTRETWPNLQIDCSRDEQLVLRETELMFSDSDSDKEHWAVLNGPGIAAVRVVYGDGLKTGEIKMFKRLRALDSDWYDIANAVAIKTLIEHRRTSEPNYLKELVESLSDD